MANGQKEDQCGHQLGNYAVMRIGCLNGGVWRKWSSRAARRRADARVIDGIWRD
jgi:hypothetical protein